MARYRIQSSITQSFLDVFSTNIASTTGTTQIVVTNSDNSITTFIGTGLAVVSGIAQPGGLITSIVRSASSGGTTLEIVDQLGGANSFTSFWNAPDNAARFSLATSQADQAFGTFGVDVINLGVGDNDFTGYAGNDVFIGGSGFDWLSYAAEASATVPGTQGVIVNLSSGSVTAEISGGTFTVASNSAKDSYGSTDTFTSIEGASGTLLVDAMYGGIGDDSLRPYSGSDYIDGGAGYDELQLSGANSTGAFVPSAAAVVTYTPGSSLGGIVNNDGFGGTDTFVNIERIRGTHLADTFNGNNADNSFRGLAGNDTLIGGNGTGVDDANYARDASFGGSAGIIANLSAATVSGTITAGTFNVAAGTARDGFGNIDTLIGIETIVGTNIADVVYGGSANELFRLSAGADFINGGGGIDEWIAAGTGTPTNVAIAVNYNAGNSFDGTVFNDGFNSSDAFVSIERIRGSQLGDNFTGNDADNTFLGLAGVDILSGGLGADLVDHSHDDNYGGLNGVIVNLSASQITATVTGGTFTVDPGRARDGFGALDVLLSIENAKGTIFDDYFQGTAEANSFIGDGGNDTLVGDLGNDTLDGGTGTDTANLGTLASYAVKWGSTAANMTVSGDQGIDVLRNVETLRFSDNATPLATTALAKVFTDPALGSAAFGYSNAAGGWSSDNLYHRELADVNGDGRADIVGFGGAGTFVALATGGGNFANAFLATATYGFNANAGSWTNNDLFPRTLGDVNGDGRADIVGFGDAGVWVSMANASGGFGAASLVSNSFGRSNAAGGWSSDSVYHREIADVNGDGLGDIVGFGGAGTFVALATGGGNFGSAVLASGSFGFDASAGSWGNNDLYPRTLADINGDGREDIVGFGSSGVYAALATSGGGFASAFLANSSFGADASAGGWTSDNVFHREMADINGDGLADIVGFGGDATYAALATSGGAFTPAALAIGSFGYSTTGGGWSTNDKYPRMLADVTGDGNADIVGFGEVGAFVAQYNDWFYV